jgi:hypothetical protein
MATTSWTYYRKDAPLPLKNVVRTYNRESWRTHARKTPVGQAPGLCGVPLFFTPILARRAGPGGGASHQKPCVAKSGDAARMSTYATTLEWIFRG